MDLNPSASESVGKGYRPADVLTFIYFTATTAVLLAAGDRGPRWWGVFALHAAILGGVFCLRFVPRNGPKIVAVLRDWYPVALLPYLYGEIAYLNQLHVSGYFDSQIIALELALFKTHAAVHLREWLPYTLLSEYLHASYLLYLGLVPGCAFFFYLRGRRKDFRVFVSTILLTFFPCFIVFILYPVAGPYYTFARPDPAALGPFFSRISHWVVQGGSSEGAAFPSSHVAVALACALAARKLDRRLFFWILPIAAGVPVAVIYGGFHYAVDSIAGLAAGFLFGSLGPRVYRLLA